MNLNLIKWMLHLLVGQFMFYEGEPGGGGGSGDDDWRSSLPEDLRENPALQNFNDVGSLAKSFVETKAMQGNSIRVPGQDAGEEDWQRFNQSLIEKVPTLMAKPDFNNEEQSTEFYRQLGMPENAEGYELPEIEGIKPEEISEEVVSTLRNLSHEGKLSKAQFKKIATGMIKKDAEVKVAAMEGISESLNGLRSEWGNAYDVNVAEAKKTAELTGAPKELMQALETGLVRAETLKWLHAVGKQLGSEGREIGGQGNNNDQVMTPADAKAAISEILANNKHPYFDARHPGHEDAIKRMVELQRHAIAGQ